MRKGANMNGVIEFTIDGVSLRGRPGQTILDAADEAGIYIPRLCYLKGLASRGSCRICTVLVNGRPQAACGQPIADGLVVENDTEQLRSRRRNIVEMLLVEGNHFCMFCEKSGNCELQALAYRLGVMAPKYPYQFLPRDVDASHSGVFIDRNRCVLCGRCVHASCDLDGKNVFQFVGRGAARRVAVNAEAKLSQTNADATDEAVSACPVGAILRKRVGYAVPIGRRRYDIEPIGSDIEARRTVETGHTR